MSIEEGIEEFKRFYLAGKETTSSWLTWAMMVLALHPEWQEMAREEVLQVCGQKEPNFEALTHLKIVSNFPLIGYPFPFCPPEELQRDVNTHKKALSCIISC